MTNADRLRAGAEQAGIPPRTREQVIADLKAAMPRHADRALARLMLRAGRRQ